MESNSSVIIRVISKIRWPRSGSLIHSSQVWLPTELDDIKSCVTIISLKKQQLTWQNAKQQHAYLMHSVHLHRHDVLTVPLTVLLHWWRRRKNCTDFFETWKWKISVKDKQFVLLNKNIEVPPFNPQIRSFTLLMLITPSSD